MRKLKLYNLLRKSEDYFLFVKEGESGSKFIIRKLFNETTHRGLSFQLMEN